MSKCSFFILLVPQWVSQVKWYSSPPLFQPALHPQTLLPILLFCLSEHALHLYAACCMQITCSDLSHKSCSSFACALGFSCRVRTKKKKKELKRKRSSVLQKTEEKFVYIYIEADIFKHSISVFFRYQLNVSGVLLCNDLRPTYIIGAWCSLHRGLFHCGVWKR